MQNLAGKVAVVTGASSGIGEAVARSLVAEGVHVVLVGRRADRLAALVGEFGDAATAETVDVTDSIAVSKMFARIAGRFGHIDLLVNNAGLGIHGAFVDSNPEDWKRQFDTNVLALFACTQAAIPLMQGRPGAMISSIASVAGRYGVQNWSVYSASKYAVVGFHEALRKEVAADGIRVSLIEPGAVWTDFGPNIDQSARRREIDALTADDVAQAMIYSFAQPPRVLVQEILIRPLKQVAP